MTGDLSGQEEVVQVEMFSLSLWSSTGVQSSALRWGHRSQLGKQRLSESQMCSQ